MENKPDLQELMLKIMASADRWARNVLREDKELTPDEQELCKLVLEYCRASRQIYDAPVELPPPPKIPKDLMPPSFSDLFFSKDDEEDDDKRDTTRYDEKPTRPSPAYGIPAINPPKKGL